MRLLLDTHAFIWWMQTPAELSPKAQREIGSPDNRVYVSAISFMEIGIKQSYGKLTTDKPFENSLEILQFTLLPLSDAHGLAIKHLPLHHKDPFDRVLIAQASSEGLTIVTRDRMFTHYPIPVLIA